MFTSSIVHHLDWAQQACWLQRLAAIEAAGVCPAHTGGTWLLIAYETVHPDIGHTHQKDVLPCPHGLSDIYLIGFFPSCATILTVDIDFGQIGHTP